MTPELQSKVSSACQVLDSVFSRYKNPCFMYSGGKDACLVLHMLENWYSVPPVVWFHRPVSLRKIMWGLNNLASKHLNCIMHIPPAGTCITKNCEGTEVVYAYPFGKSLMMIPIGRQNFEDHKDWSCGLEMLKTPIGSYDFPYDVAISGQHADDDAASTSQFYLKKDSCDIAFPLKEFTNEDVWELIDLWEIPINPMRYQKVDGKWSEYADRLLDNDYHPYCNRCFDIDGDSQVHCPKLGCSVCSVKNQFPIWKLEDIDYVRKS